MTKRLRSYKTAWYTSERYRAYRRSRANSEAGHERRKKYEKTPKGFLARKYHNMSNRVKGILKVSAHLYKGKSILKREDFYSWAMESPEFWKLFEAWSASNHQLKLSPTVNRIDPKLGYEIGNMEWLTHGDNSRLGAINGAKNRNAKGGVK